MVVGKTDNIYLAEHLITLSPTRSSEKCCNDKTIKTCFGAKVNIDNLMSGDDVTINDVSLTFRGQVPPHGRVYKNNEGDEAIITYNNDTGNVFGSLKTHKGESFALEKCENSHVWIEFDLEMLESMHQEPKYETLEEDTDRKFFPSSISDTSTAIMSILVYYTLEFRDATSDIQGFVNQAIAETNQGYANSQIPLVAEVFCTKEAHVRDSEDGLQQLEDFSRMLGTVRALRNSADIAILLVKDSSYCGVASTIHSIPSGNNYAWVHKGCALGYYSFGHEIGHLFGAGHNREVYLQNRAFFYGHGFLIPNGYRSIMSYHDPNHRRRVNHYSNPDVSYNGNPTGKWTSNNAKVIINNRFAMAASGREESNCKSTGKRIQYSD